MSKVDFQDGVCGGHIGFLIDKILAHFNPEVVLLLQSKFQLNSTKGLGRMLKLDFQDGGCAIKFQLNWILVFRDVQNRNSQHFSHINV